MGVVTPADTGPLPRILPGDFPCATGCGLVILWIDGTTVWAGDDEDTTVNWLRGVFGRQISHGVRVILEIWGPFYRGVYLYDPRHHQFKILDFEYLT